MAAADAKLMTEIKTESRDGYGSLWYEAISVDASTDPYILPGRAISSIAADQSGDGGLYFTNDPEAVIKAGDADWEAWDGSSLINTGVTGFYVGVTSGTVAAKITVRTYN